MKRLRLNKSRNSAGAAQLGPESRSEPKCLTPMSTVSHLTTWLRNGCPSLALTAQGWEGKAAGSQTVL